MYYLTKMAVIALASQTLSISTVSAQQSALYSVKGTMEACESRDSPLYLYCLGKMAGAADMLGINCYLPTNPALPRMSSVEYDALAQSFVIWARANPHRWNEPWGTGFIDGVVPYYECD